MKAFILYSLLILSSFCAVADTTISQKVNINYIVNNVSNIDYVAHTFEVDFYFRMWWKVNEDKLRDRLAANGLQLTEGMNIPIKCIDWLPENDFVNAEEIDARRQSQYIFQRGNLLFDMRYRGTFNNQMSLQRFPFDRQTLKIKLEDFAKTKELLVFRYGEESDSILSINETYIVGKDETFESTIEFSEFKLDTLVEVKLNEHKLTFNDESEFYNQLELSLFVSRKVGYYYSKIVSISCLIVIMSWVVFFIDPKSFGERSAYSITAFLAMVGHNYLTNNLLPMISYITVMDFFTISTNLLVFATFPINLWVYRMQKNNTERAKRIDKISGYLFPFLLVLLFFLFSYSTIILNMI